MSDTKSNSKAEQVLKRIFIGGLSESVSASELQQRFSHFGSVSNVSLKTRVGEDGAPLKSFAHLDLHGDEASIKKCFNTYQNAKWKGSVMKLQFAKESVLERLQREREESVHHSEPEVKPQQPAPAEVITTAKGVPGTPVPGKKDWVVGKYGRALPVMKLKKSYKIPMEKLDPSKHCHAARVFKEDGPDHAMERSCDTLTWEIDQPDSEITKKRKGEFPNNTPKPKRNRTQAPLQQSKPPEKIGVLQNGSASPFGSDLLGGGKLSLSQLRSSDELEIVKIGAPSEKPKSSNLGRVSNKFDSDVESDSEARPFAPKEKKKPGKPPPEKGEGVDQSGKSSAAPRDVAEAQSSAVNGFSRPGSMPGFKGLSMLQGFERDSNSTEKSGSGKEMTSAEHLKVDRKLNGSLSELQTGLPECERTTPVASSAKVLQSSKLDKKSVPHEMSVTFDTDVSSVSHPRTKQSDLDPRSGNSSTVATPAPFSNVRDRNNFKTSTPHAPSSPAKEILSRTARQSFEPPKSLPAFEGLGMLKDFSIRQTRVNRPPTSVKSQDTGLPSKDSNTVAETPASTVTETPASTGSTKQNITSTISKTKSAGESNSSSILPNSPKDGGFTKQNFPPASGKTDSAGDSDSSTGTDEIILRHQAGKSPASAPVPRVPPKPDLPKKKSPPGGAALVSSEHLSEFVSGVTDGDEISLRNPSHARESSGNESYDSDLDSNDFALVAKKLRQQMSGHGKAGATQTKDRKKKESPGVEKSSGEKVKDDNDRALTDLQGRLAGIAGLQNPRTEATTPKSSGESGKLPKREPLSEREKRAAANEKRLEAMKEQARHRQQQHEIMQQAFKQVDSGEGNTKRIVFESSGEESASEAEVGGETVSAGSEEKQETQGPSLFTSSDDESDDDYDEMFKSKPQFEGKKGEKLLKMERRFGDKRFKLDARFVDTDSEKEDEDVEGEESKKDSVDADAAPSDLTASLKEEKSASLKVLETVVGKTTLDRFSEKINRNTKKIVDMNTLRFDPTKLALVTAPPPDADSKTRQTRKELSPSRIKSNSDGSGEPAEREGDVEQPQQETKQKEKKKSLAKKSDAVADAKPSNVELSSSLVDLFKSKVTAPDGDAAGESFSLSHQFGAADSDVEEEEDSAGAPAIINFMKNKQVDVKAIKGAEDLRSEDGGVPALGERTVTATTEPASFSGSDSSSEEEADEREDVEKTSSASLPHSTLAGEAMDAEVLDSGRVDVRFSKEAWLEQWDTLRQTFIKIYKKKHKDALKKKRLVGETKRKKEFLKNSRKMGKKSWGSFKKR